MSPTSPEQIRAAERRRQPAAAAAAAKSPSRSGARGTVQSIGFAILLALVFRQFVFQAFRIPSGSMESTLLVGDFLFVNKFLYGAQFPFTSMRLPGIRPPRVGDIIVFKAPHDGRDFIKRCVGVAGDTIEVRSKVLYRNGVAQREPYVQHTDPYTRLPGTDQRDTFGPFVVPKGNLFMMGDNRDNSQDSRFWGPAPVANVKGKAVFIYFSVSKWLPPHLRLRRFGRIIH